MKITNNKIKQLLFEGRYDSLVNSLSSAIFKKWKTDIDSGLLKSIYTDNIISDNFDFKVNAVLKRNNSDDLNIDGNYQEKGDINIINIYFDIGKKLLPEYWKEISFNLKDVLRHEIEHITQNDDLNFPSKYMENDQDLRHLINLGLLDKSKYFLLQKEIDANLQGMYLRAKKEKIPFIEVIKNYLKTQKLTKEETKEILQIWNKRAKELNLPKLF